MAYSTDTDHILSRYRESGLALEEPGAPAAGQGVAVSGPENVGPAGIHVKCRILSALVLRVGVPALEDDSFGVDNLHLEVVYIQRIGHSVQFRTGRRQLCGQVYPDSALPGLIKRLLLPGT